MIKIIKEGKLPIKSKVIFTAKCDKCNCEFQFEQEDFTKIERRIDGYHFIACPCCSYEIVGKYEDFNPNVVEDKEDGVQ